MQHRKALRGSWSHSLVAVAVSLMASSAAARTPNTDRVLRNLVTVIDNVQVNEAFASAPIAETDRQTAQNLLRDVDYALKRADALDRISPEDVGDPDVKALAQRVAALEAFRDKLAANLSSSQAAGAALDKRYRAFRDDVRPFAKALALFPEASGSSQAVANVTPEVIRTSLAQLADLDQVCKAKYADIEFNDRLAFQLAINPVKVCATAGKRQELATALVHGLVRRDLATWVKMVDDATASIDKTEGFVGISGAVVEQLVFDRPKGKASFLAKYEPLFAATGAKPPADLLGGLDSSLDALWAEIDRLAPTYKFPTAVHHDAGVEAGGKKAVTSAIPGSSAIKSAMLFKTWDIAKNSFDIPTERYWTGAILMKVKGSKWCQYRKFTAHQDYAGGGKYAASKFTFAGLRFQQCK